MITYLMVYPYKEILYCYLLKNVNFYMLMWEDLQASQLVNYKTCEPIKLSGKETRKWSTKLLTLVSFGMGDGY